MLITFSTTATAQELAPTPTPDQQLEEPAAPPSQPVKKQPPQPQPPLRRSNDDGYTSRDSMVLSMMGWGIGLAIGICTFCALIEKNPAPTD